MNLSKKLNRITSASKRSAKMCALPLVMAAVLPGQLMAATECPADLQLSIESSSDIFAIGEPVPIRVDLRMGDTASPTKVNFAKFQHLLDCEGATDFADCKANGGVPGNVIKYVEGSAKFVDELNDPPCPIAGLSPGDVVGVSDGVITVDFTFEDANDAATTVELNSTNVPNTFNSCGVTFEVVVEELSNELAVREIIEWTGFSKSDTVCTEGDDDQRPLESESEEQLSFRIANPNSVFWVTKDFTDNNEDPVEVHLRCDAGTYTNPDFDMLTDPATDGTFDIVGFVVYNIPSTGANCTIYEDPIPSGYSVTYEADVGDGAEYDDYGVLGEDDDEGCFFDAVKGGEFFCDITNEGIPAEFTVNKEWVIYGDGGNEVNEEVFVTITCDRRILNGGEKIGRREWVKTGYLGDGDSLTAEVRTRRGEVVCSAVESVNTSGVESVDDCQKDHVIPPGGKDECTFVNTVFFEGIPTLNQYGVALMALLMLGFGVFAFRRIV